MGSWLKFSTEENTHRHHVQWPGLTVRPAAFLGARSRRGGVEIGGTFPGNQWGSFRENLQETRFFFPLDMGLSCKFCLKHP